MKVEIIHKLLLMLVIFECTVIADGTTLTCGNLTLD